MGEVVDTNSVIAEDSDALKVFAELCLNFDPGFFRKTAILLKLSEANLRPVNSRVLLLSLGQCEGAKGVDNIKLLGHTASIAKLMVSLREYTLVFDK